MLTRKANLPTVAPYVGQSDREQKISEKGPVRAWPFFYSPPRHRDIRFFATHSFLT